MRERIVYTRPNGEVWICIPSDNAVRWMANGGRWAEYSRGFLDIQIERDIAEGVLQSTAVRYARAMHFGGCTTAEALEILRDRDCRTGTAHELYDMADLPDRWFRDAWRRGHNGGPICIDRAMSRVVQFRRIKLAAEKEAARRANDMDLVDRPLDLPWGAIRDRINASADENDLRRIWPEELGHQI